jgi:predicted DNA-binding transcriptional regulator YafY
MNRIDRISTILIHLQSKPLVKAQEIADRFGISLRTVYRDIRTLEEAGVPLGSEAGKGYFLADGYHLPPVMFTEKEAGSMLIAEKLVEKFTDQSIDKHFKSALYKIKSVLKPGEQEYLNSLDPNIVISAFATSAADGFPNNFIADIQKAIGEERIIQLHYHSLSKNELTMREIEPIGISFYASSWHLIGYCLMRKDYRDFRINRIRQLTVTDRPIVSKNKKTLSNYFRQLSKKSDLHSFKIRVRPEVKDIIDRQKYFFGFVGEENKKGFTEMAFLASSLETSAYWLLSYCNGIEIIEPDALLQRMKNLVHDLQKHYLA